MAGVTTPTQLEAGREMDALVAEKVMEWQVFRNRNEWRSTWLVDEQEHGPWVSRRREGVPDYGLLPRLSTDIAAAWPVVEHMVERGELTRMSRAITRALYDRSSVPLAICRAALAAVGEPRP